VRHPITPLARIWSALIRNTAAATFLQIIKGSYAEIPAGIRFLLLGHVMHQVMMQAAFWTKREEF